MIERLWIKLKHGIIDKDQIDTIEMLGTKLNYGVKY